MSAVYAVYFSPTHSSRTIARTIAGAMAGRLSVPVVERDLTLPSGRESPLELREKDALVLGYPVYGGRLPLPLARCLSRLTANGAPAVLAAVYGNRAYEDALLEGADLLSENGFLPLAAGAFVAEHSYTARVGAGRPGKEDLDLAGRFGTACADKLLSGDRREPSLPGNRPYKERRAGSPLAPLTGAACTRCGACAAVCPMGVIHPDDPAQTDSGCLGCMACVKTCPLDCKSFDSPRIREVTAMLEANCLQPKEPEFFL